MFHFPFQTTWLFNTLHTIHQVLWYNTSNMIQVHYHNPLSKCTWYTPSSTHHNIAPTVHRPPKLFQITNFILSTTSNQSTTTFQHSTALSFKSMFISSTKTFQCMLAQLAAEYPTCNLQPNLPNIYFHLFFCFPGMYSTSSVSSQVWISDLQRLFRELNTIKHTFMMKFHLLQTWCRHIFWFWTKNKLSHTHTCMHVVIQLHYSGYVLESGKLTQKGT